MLKLLETARTAEQEENISKQGLSPGLNSLLQHQMLGGGGGGGEI